LTVNVRPQWKDHHFRGRPVLPAVEAMQILAVRARHANPGMDVGHIKQARFPKFLEIDSGNDALKLIQSLTAMEDGSQRATLGTRVTKGTARITRNMMHAEMHFTSSPEQSFHFPLDVAAAVEGLCETIDPDIIYHELVPFGPRFRSICRPLVLSPAGALASVRAPHPSSDDQEPLGSPFPLDGAFHAACVWGQRYAQVVAFPVGLESRSILLPTTAEETYSAHIVPVQASSGQLIFDIRLLDVRGRIREEVLGVDMRDVSRGGWQPPTWIVEKTPEPVLSNWSDHCQGLVLLDRRHLAPFAHLALTEAETLRLGGMGEKRRNAYISARLACKRLWRKLAHNDSQTFATAIETITPDRPQPVLPPIQGGSPLCCSVSHDQRFCIAVAHNRPVGVDLEKITPRSLGACHLFMHASEQTLVNTTAMDQATAALRIWSIKEAASKALNITLAQAWEQIEVISLGEESLLRIGDGKEATAIHDTVEGHLVTLVADLA
jgi:phosphopantetheinyl transferase